MKITVNVSDETVQSYLDHYNDENGTDLNVKTLTDEQTKVVQKGFQELSEGEIDMRTDDHDGFETANYFSGL